MSSLPHSNSGMVDFEKIINTEIEIIPKRKFFLNSKPVLVISVFEKWNFDFGINSGISKFLDSEDFDINFNRLYFETYLFSTYSKILHVKTDFTS
jgi:hypothetical protein